MSKFIELTEANGDKLYVNLDHVYYVKRTNEYTYLFPTQPNSKTLSVRESPQVIMSRATH